MNVLALERTMAFVTVLVAGRVWTQFRVGKRKRIAFTTPLVDGALLEAALAPRPKDSDDADLLAELRDTFAHLNRRAYAEEFWNLHEQIVALDTNLGPNQKATLRRALLRLLIVNDRWLQLVAAKACAELNLQDAINPLRGLLEMGDSQRFTVEKTEYSKGDTADLRYRQELETALERLTGTREAAS